ncbi:heavy metal translocating P-type ATPase [Peribacillus frigoritolerans]|uniref:heavy metal translocating P-type ATPase n=1 Tax=Peribacillus frigoritolerans TaxID=450367 RepID=UPI002E1CE6C4|nr:heavy metal translocating P-type ATPase [Peribacillus frigoritolerans]MED4632835.1 heavy metal translocating P-type ATPase [Peribacillus frigoritolerans]
MADECCNSKENNHKDKNKSCCSSTSNPLQKTNDNEPKSSCCSSDFAALEKPNEAKSSCCSSDSVALEKPNEAKSSCCSSDFAALEKPNEAKSSCCSSNTVALEKPNGAKSSCCSSKVEDEGQITDIPLSSSASEGKVVYRVHGMDCPACAVTIEKGLSALNGIRDVTVNYSTAKLQVVGDSGSFDQIENHVQNLGYTLESVEQNQNMRTYNVEGMDCGSCAKSIENHLNTLPSVRNVSVNFSTGKMKIEHDNSVEDIVSEVAKIGYKSSLVSRNSKPTQTSTHKDGKGLITLSGILIALGFIGSYNDVLPLMSNILYAIAILLSGYKPVKSAYYALKSRSLDMNVLMSAAAIGAALIGEWLEGATVVWLFAVGIALQNRSIEKTRNSIRNLMDLAPPEAWVLTGSELVRKPVEEISIGQVIVVKPGDKIPLDGEIIQGISSINQAPITGESIPVDKEIGDTVYAGTINESGSLEIKVTKLVADTTISKIIHLVEEAQEQKAPTQAFVDKFATIYTPIVFVLALVVMVLPPILGLGTWGEWFYKGLELLVVACPCALVISTPVAIVSAIGNAAKNGVLIKGGTFLETAGSINAIAFDKTGTLTEGKPKVSEIKALGTSDDELLSVALTLEDYSTHPIAKTIVNYTKDKGIQSKNGQLFKSIVGKGVQATIDGVIHYAGNLKLFEEMNATLGNVKTTVEEFQRQGKTVVIIGTEQKIMGIIAVSDIIRKTTVTALNGLKQIGINQTVMLTGDNEGTAKMIASEAPIDRYIAELMPEDKVSSIKQLQNEGYKVAMVGDGINDAPALATADLGIAMGGAGTDTAMETADIVLMADNLEKLPHTIKLSRKALQIIKQNIWFSLIVKFIALALIFPGWLTLWIAVLSDTGAAIIVILNALRLLKVKG